MSKSASISRARQQSLLKLSPFELKDELIKLPEETYPKIGRYLRETAQAYVQEWKSAQTK